MANKKKKKLVKPEFPPGKVGYEAKKKWKLENKRKR
jgi:hypothetical protein